MKSIILAITITFSFSVSVHGQGTAQNSSLYLNQPIPGTTPEIFAPGTVSLKDQFEFGSFFSKDGKEFYYAVDSGGKAETRFMQLKNGEWTKPVKLLTDEKYSYNDPCLSPDGKQLFFISDMPLDGKGEKKDYDIWYMVRTGNGWSKPMNAGKAINSARNEYYISFAKNGAMYFSSNVAAAENDQDNYDIYAAPQKNGVFRQPLRLSDSVNTKGYEADVFVAPDESYIIFCASVPEGYGRGDLWISFKKPDGTWTKAKNMGKLINTPGTEFCPFVSGDGKYFFYTSNRDIYWVDSRIIDGLR